MIVPRPDAPVAFTGVHVFDGERALEQQTVVVTGNRIFAAGPRLSVKVPARATVIEGKDRTLLPGFIDTHAHIGLVEPAIALRGGVTTVRDLGWPLERIAALVHELAGRVAAGPRVQYAGPMITAIGGYPSKAGWAPEGTARPVLAPDEARAAVRDLAARGAGVIKVAQDARGPTMPHRVLEAIVREAHAVGRIVTSHVTSVEQIEIAVEAGVDELAHGLWSDERIPETLTHRLVRSRTAIVPTLHVAPVPARIANVRDFVADGGRVLYGTDMGNPPARAGIDVEEARLMVEAGMTPEQVLRAATADAARQMRTTGRGRIQPGWFADLILVDGDPLSDVAALGRLAMVMREGVGIG